MNGNVNADKVLIYLLTSRPEKMPDQVGHDVKTVRHDVKTVGHDVKTVRHDVKTVGHDSMERRTRRKI